MSVFQGVDHVGVGVGDIDEAIAFYGRRRLRRVLFDCDRRAARRRRSPAAHRARAIAMLERAAPPRSARAGEARPGARRRRAAARPRGPGLGRGRGVRDLPPRPRRRRGARAPRRRRLRRPDAADERPTVPPTGISLDISYVADPWGTKLEMIEWTGLWRSLPGPARAEGVNHVAFGVTDMARSRTSTSGLGSRRCCSSRSTSSTRWHRGSRSRGTTRPDSPRST